MNQEQAVAPAQGLEDVALAQDRPPRTESLLALTLTGLLGQVLDDAPVGYVQADLQGRMIRVNRRWCEMLQFSEAELLGRSLQDLTHPEDRPHTLAALHGMADGGPNFSIDKRYIRRDGSTLWATSSVTALHGAGGEYQGLVAIVQDMSAHKAHELELQRLAREVGQADQRKSEFLATLAHELRNPLAPLSQALHMLRVEPGNAAQVRQSGEIMARQVKHLTRLVDELLDVARISRGKLVLKPAKVTLQTVVQSAQDLSMPLVLQHKHSLQVDLPDAPVYLQADATRLAQVMANLLNNAAKYTPEGGHIRVSAWLHGQCVSLSVQDNGVGIPAEDLPHLFEMFTQVGRSLEMAQGGLGIGLSLSKQLVELHGGHIRVASEGIGRGTEVTVDLPTCAPPQEALNAGPASRQGKPCPLRLLVVDDNADGADTLAALLQMDGHQTAVAYDGPSALAQMERFAPQAAFLDLSMPGMDGFELARQLRCRRPDVLLVALTGWAADADRKRSQAAGFLAHLSKPVDLAVMQATLHRIGELQEPDRLAGF